jgi:hypothetical protein
MPTEIGQFTQLAYIQEAQFGTTPATPTGQKLPIIAGLSLAPEADYIDNPTFRTDGMVAVGRRGALKGKGTIPGKLAYGQFDDFLAAACGLFEWAANVIKIKDVDVAAIGASTVSVLSAGKTYTRSAGSYLTDGMAVGDYVQWSGFTNAGNNITVKITTLTATVMTCANATGMVDEATVSNTKCVTNIRPSFTVEKGHLLTSNFFPFLGLCVNSVKMSGKTGEAVDISFDVLTKAVSNEATATLFTTLTAVNTNPLITAWDGSIKRNTVAMAQVVGWEINLTRNMDTAEVVGSSVLYDIQPKAHRITGSLELYFDSAQAYTDFRAETDLAIQINLGPGGTKSYQLDLTKVRYKNWKGDPKDGLGTVSVDFESYAPDSGTNTSFMLTRLP